MRWRFDAPAGITFVSIYGSCTVLYVISPDESSASRVARAVIR